MLQNPVQLLKVGHKFSSELLNGQSKGGNKDSQCPWNKNKPAAQEKNSFFWYWDLRKISHMGPHKRDTVMLWTTALETHSPQWAETTMYKWVANSGWQKNPH